MNFITLRVLINDLLLVVRGGNISSSETISTRQLEDWIHQYRSVLLKRDLDKGKKPNPDYIQEIGNLKLEKVDLVGDNVITTWPGSYGVESDTYIYRTILEIPKTIDLNFTSGFTYIGTPVGDEIQFAPEGRTRWQKYKKYTSKDKLCFLRGGHIYIVNSEALEFITVRGIFEIPSEVGRFVNPVTDQPYFNLDSRYPIPVNLVPALKDMIVQKELKIEATAPTDTRNDDMNIPSNISNT